jgi:hypothetical protein
MEAPSRGLDLAVGNPGLEPGYLMRVRPIVIGGSVKSIIAEPGASVTEFQTRTEPAGEIEKPIFSWVFRKTCAARAR